MKTCADCGIAAVYAPAAKRCHACRRLARLADKARYKLTHPPKLKQPKCVACGATSRVLFSWGGCKRCMLCQKEHVRSAVKLRSAAWSKDNRERRLEISRDFRERHKGRELKRIREQQRERRSSDREAYCAYMRAYRKTPTGRANVKNGFHRRRARERAAYPNMLTAGQWRDIVSYFGNACAYCLRSDAGLTQEHVVALSRGGMHVADNVVPACLACNLRKGDRGIVSMLRLRRI